MPEIPLSVGSKLELLLRAAKFPCTSPYTHAFVRVCIIMPCIFVYISYVQCTSQRRRGFCTLVPSLTLGAHAQEGYGTCPVCLFVRLSVCYHLVVNIVRFYGLSMVRTALV